MLGTSYKFGIIFEGASLCTIHECMIEHLSISKKKKVAVFKRLDNNNDTVHFESNPAKVGGIAAK